MAAGCVRLLRGAAADHEKVRYRLFHDHQAGVEPVQQDSLRYDALARYRRFGGVDPSDHDPGREPADQGFLHHLQRDAAPGCHHGRLDALPE